MRANHRLSLIIVFLMVLQLAFPYGSWQKETSAATLGPVIVSLSPNSGATNVGQRPKLQVTFDENIVKKDTSKQVYIYRYSDNASVDSYRISDSSVTVANNVLTISVNKDLGLNTEYYVLIEAGAVANSSNDALFAGISDPKVWNFKTTDAVDKVKPKLVDKGQLCESTGTCNTKLSITSSFALKFDEPVYVSSGNILLQGAQDSRSIPVTSSEITGSGTNVITITPSTPLQPSTLYTLTITSSNFTDAAGNPFDGGTWKFNTDESPVKLEGTSPSNNATNVNVSSNIELYFNQNVAASNNKRVQIRNASNNELVFDKLATDPSITINNKVVTIDPPANLNPNTYYYVTIEPGAFYLSGSPSEIFYGLSNATDFRFQTGVGNDTTPPTIKTYSPAKGGSGVGTAEKISLTFSEPVYVKSGTIEIREYNSGALYRSIDVTSNRITGGGTTVLTIDPHSAKGETAKSFTVGTRYYVTISKDAIVDAAGNGFAGFSSKTSYYFTVSSTQTGPQLVSLSPVNLSTAVPIEDNVFKLTFDKPVMVDPENSVAKIINLTNSENSTTGTLTNSSTDNKVIELRPDSLLKENNDYYINIAENSIMDLGGNYFVGIQNQYQWKFKTIGGDTVAPNRVKVEVSGNEIRLVYNELLNENVVPSPAQFYVTVGGLARNVSSVKITGNVVFVTLSSAVNSGQQVLISYSKGDKSIQDLSKNIAADFANVIVTNGFTETNPVIKSSSYSGSTITLTFSETLDTLHSLAFTQFSVTVNGKATSISRISQSGTNLTITLGTSISAGSTVIVGYTQGLYPIVGLSNNKVASFSHTVGKSSSGGTVSGPPVLQTITLSGSSLLLKYNEDLKSNSAPGVYQYVIQVNGRVVTARSVSISGDTVKLDLPSAPGSNDIIYVSYYSSSQTLLDSDNNAAASFSNQLVRPSSSQNDNNDEKKEEVKVQGAVLKGDTLTVNFSGKLDTTSIPATNNFLVFIADNSRQISNISISGSQVIIKLFTPAKVGEVATISYFNTNDLLRSESGTAISGFSNVSVANQTSLLDTLSDDYGSATNGLLIKTSATTTTSDVSPGGYTVNRYTINADKLNTAISTLADAKMTNAQLVFEVPASERAAIVAFPVSSLEYASRKGNFTLVVKQGTNSYEVPVSAIDVTSASRALSGDATTNAVKLVMEVGNTSATSTLVTAVNRSGATLLEGPFYYDALVVNGARSESAKIKGNLTRTIQTTRSFTNSNTAVVFYDTVAGQLSYVPTSFSQSGSTTTVQFKRPGNSAYALVSSNKTYSDSSKHWGLSSINVMTRKFIADGHSATNFDPKTNITRGEFATYIVRGLGLSADKEAAKQFKDVNSNSVMGGYIGAAVKSGIVSGVSSTSFAPNSYITRQDMALMMIRAASYLGLDTKLSGSADSVLAGYKDKSSVSSYAKTGLAQAIQLGIISGTSGTTLSPKDNAERVQGIIMIQRLLELAGYLQK